MKTNKIPEFNHLRFLSKIKLTGDCWEWAGGTFKEYGAFSIWDKINRKVVSCRAHRVSFTLFKGEIGEGLVIDHMCRNKLCVNPDHLRAVTVTVNNLENSDSVSAINHNKEACIRGHEFSQENTLVYRGKRRCIACRPIINELRRNKRRIKNPEHYVDGAYNCMVNFSKRHIKTVEQA